MRSSMACPSKVEVDVRKESAGFLFSAHQARIDESRPMTAMMKGRDSAGEPGGGRGSASPADTTLGINPPYDADWIGDMRCADRRLICNFKEKTEGRA